jgi:hypothetical protein
MTIARLAALLRVAAQGSFLRGMSFLRIRRSRMESSHVAALQAKHEGLELRLHEELNRPAPDSTAIQALKKQKLRIKEELSFG